MHLWDYHMLEPLSSSALPTALFCDFSWRRLISSCHSFTQPSLKSQTVRPFLIGSVLLLRGSENLVILALHAVDLLQISLRSLDSIYSPVVSNTMRLNQQYCIVWISQHSQHSHKHKLKHTRLCSLKSDKDFFFFTSTRDHGRPVPVWYSGLTRVDIRPPWKGKMPTEIMLLVGNQARKKSRNLLGPRNSSWGFPAIGCFVFREQFHFHVWI